MSLALAGSSAIWRFKHSNAIEICDGITFNFYTGLPHICNMEEKVQMLHLNCVWVYDTYSLDFTLVSIVTGGYYFLYTDRKL